MKAQLRLNLGALRQVEETPPTDGDQYFLAALGLDFGGVDLALQLPRAMAAGGTEPPAAWTKLREALQEIAALAAHG